MMTYQQSQQVV